MRQFKSLVFWVPVMGIFLASVQGVNAYIPPSQYLLKSWIKKRGIPGHGKKPLRITSLIEELDPSSPPDSPTPRLTGNAFRDITWIFFEAGKLKSIAKEGANSSKDLQKELPYEEKRYLTIEKSKPQASPLAGLLFLSSFEEAAAKLKSAGTPLLTDSDLLKLRSESTRRQAEKTSLKRLNGHVSWVIGQDFWIEKDTFYPLRLGYELAAPEHSQQGRFEFDFRNYAASGDFFYPRNIRVLKDGKPFCNVTVTETASDGEASKWPGSAQSRSRPLDKPSLNFLEGWEPSPSAIKELILTYYEALR